VLEFVRVWQGSKAVGLGDVVRESLECILGEWDITGEYNCVAWSLHEIYSPPFRVWDASCGFSGPTVSS
jgi:hypothetical protein